LHNKFRTLTGKHIATSSLLVVSMATTTLATKSASFLRTFTARGAAGRPVRPWLPTWKCTKRKRFKQSIKLPIINQGIEDPGSVLALQDK
jgi:hypothetical protein